jgi:hypothetical protein
VLGFAGRPLLEKHEKWGALFPISIRRLAIPTILRLDTYIT